MQRRSLLKLSVAAAALLAVTGGGIALLRPALVRGHLAPQAMAIFRAVALAVLDGSLPSEASGRETALRDHLKRLGSAIAAFPAETQAELSQLLALLASVPGRALVAGLHTAWSEASVADVQRALEKMRHSDLALRQQGYHALRDLTNAAFYADPSAWALLGYPGPRTV